MCLPAVIKDEMVEIYQICFIRESTNDAILDGGATVASQHGSDGWQMGGSCCVYVCGGAADGHTRRKLIVGEGGVAVRSGPTDS